MVNKSNKSKARTGPKADSVTISGEWEDAIEKALQKKRPAKGWPKNKSKGEKK